MPLNTKVAALVKDRRYGLAITGQIERLRAQQPHIADAFTSIQNAVNDIFRAIAQETELTELTVTDPITGERIAWIGGQAVGNISYSGAAFARLWVGPNADPATAPFFSGGSNVVIGKNGQIFIQDSGENTVGWLGVEQELPQTITAATNASPVVVTITAHGYIDGDTIIVAGATGNTAINGYRIVQNATANTFTMTDLLGVQINGNGAYTGTATATRYYAGLLTQTIAIGESFANYKLRAFADGTLKITDAEIILNGSGATIDLDPTTGTITVTQTGPDPRNQTVISGTGFSMSQVGAGASTIQTSIAPGTIAVIEDSTNAYGTILNGLLSIFAPSGSLALANQVQLYAYSGATGFGPMVSCTQYRGTGAAPTPTQSGDTLGGIIGWGFDGTGESQYPAGISMIAAETHTITNHGTKIIFEVTATGGSTVPTIAATISQTGLSTASDINTGGVFRKGGVAGISVTITTAKLTPAGANGSMTFSGGILIAQTQAT